MQLRRSKGEQFLPLLLAQLREAQAEKLITTCYRNCDADLFSKHSAESGIYLEYDGDKNGSRIPDPEEIGIHNFKGDGDVLLATVQDLGGRIDAIYGLTNKGVHADVSAFEMNQCVIQTYLLVGDILRVADSTSAIAEETKEDQEPPTTASTTTNLPRGRG